MQETPRKEKPKREMKLYREVNTHHDDSVLIKVYSYGECIHVGPAKPIEITEEEIWRPGMDYFSTQMERLWIDSPMYGPTKAQVLDTWHKSFDIVLSKLKG